MPDRSRKRPYKIDQVEVLKFKSATLAAQAARPAARVVNVAADLRHHWPPSLVSR